MNHQTTLCQESASECEKLFEMNTISTAQKIVGCRESNIELLRRLIATKTLDPQAEKRAMNTINNLERSYER